MKFREIAKRITGFSTPIFGVSWNPDNTERDIARKVISYLEDRRVLYAPFDMEYTPHCIQSVLQMREFLTSEIGAAPENTVLLSSLRAMRAACRKFQNQTGDHRQIGRFPSGEINGALGELRAAIGIHVARMAVAYGIDVEKELASILPEEDEK
jgi:hypothetical protein